MMDSELRNLSTIIDYISSTIIKVLILLSCVTMIQRKLEPELVLMQRIRIRERKNEKEE